MTSTVKGASGFVFGTPEVQTKNASGASQGQSLTNQSDGLMSKEKPSNEPDAKRQSYAAVLEEESRSYEGSRGQEGNRAQKASVLGKDFSNYRVVAVEGTGIEGELSFSSPVRFEGEVSGKVFSSDIIVVGRNAVVKAAISARSIIVLGEVRGPLNATHSVVLHQGSATRGKVSSPRLVIEEGAVFNGKTEMASRKARAAL